MSDESKTRKRFRLGTMMATPGALQALEESGEVPAIFLQRHAHGDWGDLTPDDKAMNEQAIAHEGDLDKQLRVLSCFKTALGVTIWIITEYDRSITTLLLPDDY